MWAVPAESEALGTPSTSRVDVPGLMSASRGRNGSIFLYLSYCPPKAGLATALCVGTGMGDIGDNDLWQDFAKARCRR